jgi:hypothetical protein
MDAERTSTIRRKFAPILLIFLLGSLAFSQNTPSPLPTADTVGVTFVDGSTSQVVVQREGKKYLVDLTTRAIREMDDPPAAGVSSSVSANDPPQGVPAAQPKEVSHVYKPGDDVVYSVPTGRRLDRHGLYINFTHRFPFESAFSGPARGAVLLGLDDFSVSSFGVRFGITSRWFASAYRSPSIIGRPIELMTGYTLLDENVGNPLNASFRFSVDGQNDFTRNFTENFELTLSKSITRRAQVYAVPTFSVHNRPLLANNGALTDPPLYQPCSAPQAAGIDPSFGAKPCANTFSLGLALAVDVRPTVALIAETIPTLVNGTDLGIHRPEYAFGIQKKIWRHAFTFGFSNGPGTIVSERAGTRATFLQQPSADKPSGMFVGFDLTRQVF